MSRVLVVAHYYPPHVGGLEVVAREFADGLQRRGHEVAVLTSAVDGPRGIADEGGVAVHRISAWNGFEGRWGVPFPVFAPSVIRTAWRQVGAADVVQVNDMLYLSSWAAAIMCWVRRTPYVVSAHVGMVDHDSRLVRGVQRFVHRTIGGLVMRRARRILPISELIEDQVLALTPRANSVVLANGVDTDRYRPASSQEKAEIRARFGLPADDVLVLFVGRAVPKKGFAHVAAAAGAGYRLVFVGVDRPDDRPDESHVYLGALPVDQTAEVYRCADLFVCASVGEAPMTVLEAMCSGLPVVLNDDQALRGLGVSGPGVHFAAMEPPALAKELSRLVESADLVAMGALAREEALTFHSRAAQVDRLEDILADVEKEAR